MDIDPEDPLIPRSTSEGVTKIGATRWTSRNNSTQWTAKDASRARFHRGRPDDCICVNIRKSPLPKTRAICTKGFTRPAAARLDASHQKALAATIVALFH